MTYPVWDISSWPVVSQEARGLDPKDWVTAPEQVASAGQSNLWLFKPIKTVTTPGYRRFDDWAERMAAALAGLIGVPAARVELAQGATELGIISRNVTPDGWSLESGDTLLSEIDGYVSCAGDDRSTNRVGHQLPNITRVLDHATGPPVEGYERWRAAEVFAGYLVFDAWIANTDRHAINWGVLSHDSDGSTALAPTFDHGSALASGTQDTRLRKTDVERFARRGFAARFEDGAKLTLVDLALGAVRDVGGRATQWLDRLAEVEQTEIDRVVGGIAGMSEVRRRFLTTLLHTNQRRLTG